MSHRVQLKDLRVGDKFRKYPDRRYPLMRIVAVRSVEFDPTTTDKFTIMMGLSGSVYTLERVDGSGKPLEVPMCMLDDVWRSGVGVSDVGAYGRLVFWLIVILLVAVGGSGFVMSVVSS